MAVCNRSVKGSDIVDKHRKCLQEIFPLEAPSLLAYVESRGRSLIPEPQTPKSPLHRTLLCSPFFPKEERELQLNFLEIASAIQGHLPQTCKEGFIEIHARRLKDYAVCRAL